MADNRFQTNTIKTARPQRINSSDATKDNKPSISPKTGGSSERKLQSNIQRHSAITVTPQSIIRNKSFTKGFQHPTSTKAGVLGNVKSKVQNTLQSENDSGASALSTTITAGVVSTKTFRTAQKATPYALRMSQGTYQMGTKAVKIVRTVDSTLGMLKTGAIRVDRETMKQLKTRVVHKIKSVQLDKRLYHTVTNRMVMTTGIKGAAKGLGLKTLRLGGNGVTSSVIGAGNMLADSEDMGTQALGLGIKSSHLTLKTTPRILKYGTQKVKTIAESSVKTGKGVYRAGKGVAGMAKTINSLGMKETIRYYRANVLKGVAKAGGSAINAGLQALKSLGMKVGIPIILIVVVAIAVTNMTTAPVSGISTIFSGSFTNKDTNIDYEVHSFLEGSIDAKKNDLVNNIMSIRDKNLETNRGSYGYIKLFANSKEINITESEIENAIYTNTELVSLIEPMFQTIMLTEYDLEPTQAQINSTLDDIWDTLIHVTTKELPSVTETYEVIDKDGKITEETETIRVLGITISTDGYYELLAKYFTDPIDQLANLSSRTAEQEDKLQALKDNYDLCLAYMEVVLDNNVSADTDISGVTFINGSRPNNDSIVNIAEMQLGNIGGEPYWSWYGFEGRVEWCAVFVSWVENQMGYISNGTVPKFSYVPDGIQWFKNKGQWAAGGYSEPIAGDIIFFDWQGDGVSDHVGIVVGNDGVNVYTIEGNSGDVARRKSYQLNSSVIYGYGLPNY